MRQKIILSLIPVTGLGIILMLLGTLRTWSAQAAATTRYVSLQNACGGRSPALTCTHKLWLAFQQHYAS